MVQSLKIWLKIKRYKRFFMGSASLSQYLVPDTLFLWPLQSLFLLFYNLLQEVSVVIVLQMNQLELINPLSFMLCLLTVYGTLEYYCPLLKECSYKRLLAVLNCGFKNNNQNIVRMYAGLVKWPWRFIFRVQFYSPFKRSSSTLSKEMSTWTYSVLCCSSSLKSLINAVKSIEMWTLV